MPEIESTIGTCALCGSYKPLLESHIIPKFAFRWLKDTSATGFMRNITAPNLRTQDGPKKHLLCHDCEERFSGYEKKFSEEIFVPFHDGQIVFEYGKWLRLFSASMAWRAVTVCLDEPGYAHVSPLLLEAQRIWQRCLMSGSSDEDIYDHHILFNYPITESAPGLELPEKFNWYHLRAFDLTVATTPIGNAFTYVLLPGVVLCSLINPLNDPQWERTLILHCGRIDTREAFYPSSEFLDFYTDRSKMTLGWHVSDKQQDAILRTLSANTGRLVTSDSLQTYLAEKQRRHPIGDSEPQSSNS